VWSYQTLGLVCHQPQELQRLIFNNNFFFLQISDLVSQRLLFRMNSSEKLDTPPMFKCNISRETALSLAQDIKVPLSDLLWE
jgi:origin recognition complex subunit 5